MSNDWPNEILHRPGAGRRQFLQRLGWGAGVALLGRGGRLSASTATSPAVSVDTATREGLTRSATRSATDDLAWESGTTRATVLKDYLVWDNHSGFEPNGANLDVLHAWWSAGVNYLSIDVGYDLHGWQDTIKNIGAFLTWLERRADHFVLVRRAEEILAAKQSGKMAVTFDIEGMNALNGDSDMVSLYYRLGVRQMLVAYNRNNRAGGGCHDEDHGLTAFGRRAIEEMNRVGMIVDCSHSGYRTTMEAMEMSSQPVVFSHSNPKKLRAHGRNVVDEQIRACARTGGVIGINGLGLFLSDRHASNSAIVDCISYVRDLVGSDHVGVGLDYAPESADSDSSLDSYFWPASEGYGQGEPSRAADPGQFAGLAQTMVDRGWPDSDVKKVLGENFLRVAKQVWK